MRRFELHRDTDVSGVSGVGLIAEGCECSDGVAVLRWFGTTKSTVVFDGGMAALMAIHAHGGLTRVVYLDPL